MVYVPLDPVALADPHVPAHNEERDAINALQDDIVGKVDRPVSPTLGSLLKWDGDKYVPTQMRLLEGNGQPEGVVAGPVGSHYIDLLATGGTPEWYKATGTGNAGWVPLLSSLPWTNISPASGWAHVAGAAGQVSMLNGVVWMRGQMKRVSGTSTNMGTITSEFRSTYASSTLWGYVRVGGLADAIAIALNTAGVLSISSAVSTNIVYLDSSTITPFRK